MQFVSTYVFYTFSTLLPSHSGVAAGLYINCTPPLEETSKQTNKQGIKFVYKNVGLKYGSCPKRGGAGAFFKANAFFKAQIVTPKGGSPKSKPKQRLRSKIKSKKSAYMFCFDLKSIVKTKKLIVTNTRCSGKYWRDDLPFFGVFLIFDLIFESNVCWKFY